MTVVAVKRVGSFEDFYYPQSKEDVWGAGKLLPDVIAAIVALFEASERHDVALLVRMVLPHRLPPALQNVSLQVSSEGEVAFVPSVTDFMTFKRDFSLCDNVHDLRYYNPRGNSLWNVLTYISLPRVQPTIELLGVGILPPMSILTSAGAEHSLALAAVANFHDVYEMVLHIFRSDPEVVEHARHVFPGIATRMENFRLFKALFREVPEIIRTLLLPPAQEHFSLQRRTWLTSFGADDNAITCICGGGGPEHVKVLRALFCRFPDLRIGPSELRAAFDNVSACFMDDDEVRQPDPLMRLICEELPHSQPSLLKECGPCLLYKVASKLDRNGGDATARTLRRFADTLAKRIPNAAQEGKLRALITGRVRYLVQGLKVSPDAAALLPILSEDMALFDELVTEHNALSNNHDDVEVGEAFWQLFLDDRFDNEEHLRLFPQASSFPVLDATVSKELHSAICRKIAVLLEAAPAKKSRIRRMKGYVKIQLDDSFHKVSPSLLISRRVFGSLPSLIRSVDDVN